MAYTDYYAELKKKLNTVPLGGAQNAPAPSYGQLSATPMANTMGGESALVNSLYDAQMQNKIASLTTARDNAMSDLSSQKSIISPMYYDARNSAQAQADLQRQRLNEQAAATGLGSGAAAQLQGLNRTALQGNLGSLRRDETKAYADVEAKVADIKRTYEQQIVAAKAEGDTARAAALLDAYVRDVNNARDDARRQQDLQIQQDNTEYNRQQDELRNKLAQAKYMAQYGNFNGFKALGYSDADIAQMQKQFAIDNMGGRTSSGGTATVETPKMSLSDAKNLASQGYFDQSVIDALYKGGYTDNSIVALYPEYAGFINGQQGAPTQNTAPTQADTSTFGAIYDAMMKSGDPGRWLNENGAYLTPQEQLYAASLVR